jgi:hypothetical protein
MGLGFDCATLDQPLAGAARWWLLLLALQKTGETGDEMLRFVRIARGHAAGCEPSMTLRDAKVLLGWAPWCWALWQR